MNNKLKENCKRKLAQLGEKAKQLNNHKSVLLRISDELDKRINIKLNNLLFDADLREEISYLNDWIEFYSKEIKKYEAKLRNLDIKIIEGMQKARETKSSKLQIEKGIKDSFKFIFKEAEEPKDEIKAEKAAKKSIKEKILKIKERFSGFKAQKPIIGYAAALAILLLMAASLLLLKPDITGYTILGKETSYKDVLSLKINESGTYEWQVKSPGDIKSIKAAGSVIGNGSVKIYIEKDGKMYMIYKNK